MACVITCFKSVIDEDDVSVSSTGAVSLERAHRKISDYEKCALGAGSQLATDAGAQAVCLTYGPDAIGQEVKDALSRGSERAICVIDPSAETATAQDTANVLAAAVTREDDVRAVVCSDGSSDVFQKQTAPRMAARLGWPYVGNVVDVKPDGDAFTVTQKAEGIVRTVRVQAPAVFAMVPDSSKSKTPGMREILAAKKKPQTQYSVADLGVELSSNIEVEPMEGFVMSRKNIMIEGTPQEAAAELVGDLKTEGVLA
jgi:electron transfer flavoprotein beta subunit